MFRSRTGVLPMAVVLNPVHCVVLGMSLLLGACASSSANRAPPPTAQAWPGAFSPSRVAGYVAKAPIDLEDDGIEAQHPPLRRAKREADDPTEPFSPNYGEEPIGTVSQTGMAGSRDGDEQISDLPDDLPPAI